MNKWVIVSGGRKYWSVETKHATKANAVAKAKAMLKARVRDGYQADPYYVCQIDQVIKCAAVEIQVNPA